MTIRRYLYILIASTLIGCDDDAWGLLPEQQELLGKAVNFSATQVDEFNHQTRATYNDTGVFNENDLMRIFRQYRLEDGTWGEEAYRTYYFNTKYATGTSISLGTDWKVYAGRQGKDSNGTVITSQTAADSITWEDGRTVRFRSWTRSNYANALEGCYKNEGAGGLTNYYPDYCISDWVTVSGPTKQIPLTMRHICSRIAISYRNNGSQFYKAEIDTIWQDYKRIDNADSSDHDQSTDEASKTDAEAQNECNQVLAAYYKMCMPAGVDIGKSELYAMKKDFWAPLGNNDTDNKKLRFLEDQDDSNFYHYGTENSTYIKSDVQHPVFANVNTSCYLITIPYDMSNEATQGDVIVLPACTRFRIYLRDVNNGDENQTPGYEGTYHIFSLKDIKGTDGQSKFPNGLAMMPGYSYKFYVGYRYGQLTVTANDNFSWTAQDSENDDLEEDVQTYPETSPEKYTWWKQTIKDAIPSGTGGDFNPVFHIKDSLQFIEFINLVNGTAALQTEGLDRAKRKVENPDHAGNEYDKYYWWYSAVSANKRDTTWVTSAEATAMGYLLYQSYHAANANQPAFSQEEYLRGAYPFYDETRDRHYTVFLDKDLDLCDWKLTSIGDLQTTPFKGYFDGQMHTISNLYMKDEYMFKYLDAAAIRNLKIESTHKVSLAKQGINTCYIVGIDLRAHSTTNSIVESLTSNAYGNPSYVVGCIHVGDAGGALVGSSANMYMYGCMQAAEGIANNTGALVGTGGGTNYNPRISFDYTDMRAQLKTTPSWGTFMCNYYDTQLSPGTHAVGSTQDLYSPLEYIRGRDSYILKAKNDNLLQGDVSFNALNSVSQRYAFYGLAAWKAMNYGIVRFNQSAIGTTHKCTAHYENNSTGYVHRYPELKPGEPATGQYENTLSQNN